MHLLRVIIGLVLVWPVSTDASDPPLADRYINIPLLELRNCTIDVALQELEDALRREKRGKVPTIVLVNPSAELFRIRVSGQVKDKSFQEVVLFIVSGRRATVDG
jgi:hypothetical protein